MGGESPAAKETYHPVTLRVPPLHGGGVCAEQTHKGEGKDPTPASQALDDEHVGSRLWMTGREAYHLPRAGAGTPP
jgi:hypothetical protein